MAGYSAMARVHGGGVRAIAWTGGAGAERDVIEVRPAAWRPPVERVQPPSVRERWTWFREELGMMTFFLLDPESWR